jgi:hypothetical protein
VRLKLLVYSLYYLAFVVVTPWALNSASKDNKAMLVSDRYMYLFVVPFTLLMHLAASVTFVAGSRVASQVGAEFPTTLGTVLTVLSCASNLGHAWPTTTALSAVDFLNAPSAQNADDASVIDTALVWLANLVRAPTLILMDVLGLSPADPQPGVTPPQVVFALLFAAVGGAAVLAFVAPRIIKWKAAA